jgi:HEAT repeat protein
MADLSSTDAGVRLRTVQMLKDAGYAEAAVPLAALVTDSQDEIQLEAIAAELNIFLAQRVVTRKRIGLVIEVRNKIVAEAAFEAGPLVLGPVPVPPEVLNALLAAARDDNPRVGLESLYAFGALGVARGGAARTSLLKTAGPVLAAMIGSMDVAYRYAAIRVIGRVFAIRPGDDPIEPIVGDAVVVGLNDKDNNVQVAAMSALGAMRYERALQALLEQFQHYGKGDMAAASLDAIARINHPSGVPLLVEQLASKNQALKAIAIEGVARSGDRTKWANVDGALMGERNDALVLAGRFAAVRLSDGALAPIVDALAKPKLHDQASGYLTTLADGGATLFVRALQDPNPRVREEVVNALSLSFDPSVIPLLTPLSADPDAEVATAVDRALARLRPMQ